jgi:hypothetical protein
MFNISAIVQLIRLHNIPLAALVRAKGYWEEAAV